MTQADPPLTSHTRLSFLAVRSDAREHELNTQRAIAERIAALLGCSFEGQVDPGVPAGALGYLVPNDTLTSLETAERFGVRGEADLFGGVVPVPYMATKTITHPLVRPDAAAPEGWCAAFGERVRDVVLPGHSAFTAEDTRSAALRLLGDGPVRLKLANGIGGAGQWIASDEAQLDEGLVALGAPARAGEGIVIERNLAEAKTYSVGLLLLGTMRASYFGTQRLTQNVHGQWVYGGSSLTVVRGGFEALARVAAADAPLTRAIAMARAYHDAALDCFAGMFASRCNYDVVQGVDARGRTVAGVLEQSWRIGGASGAEVAAIEAMRRDASLDVVRASTVEIHGPGAEVPPGATVYYAGDDPHVGRITKYAQVDRHADARAED
jgi:hypothetical protein